MVKLKYNKGQSLVEVLIALAIFIVAIATIGFLVLDAGFASRQGMERTKAVLLAKEGLEAARSIRDNSFSDLTAGMHGLALSGNHWIFSGTSDTQDQYTRSVTISNIDTYTKKIVCTVDWQFASNRTGQVELATYLTDWGRYTAIISTCAGYCQSLTYTSGICRQNAKQCTKNGEINESGGNAYCIAPTNFCCCAP